MNNSTVKLRFTDTRFIRRTRYGQFALSLGKESPYVAIESVRINGVSLESGLNLEKM